MPCEAEFLARIASQHAIVEKTTHELWSAEELRQASAAGMFLNEIGLQTADTADAISNPYPGCLQMGGAMEPFFQYQLIGQTKHFLIFALPILAASSA